MKDTAEETERSGHPADGSGVWRRRFRGDEAVEQLEDFGFDVVTLDVLGAPVPERVAERLGEIADEIRIAIELKDGPRLAAACSRLERLARALAAYPDVLQDLDAASRGAAGS
jgi:hypothetical protein